MVTTRLHAADVVGDARLDLAGARAREEREREPLQVPVDLRAQVVHHALADEVGEPRLRRRRARRWRSRWRSSRRPASAAGRGPSPGSPRRGCPAAGTARSSPALPRRRSDARTAAKSGRGTGGRRCGATPPAVMRRGPKLRTARAPGPARGPRSIVMTGWNVICSRTSSGTSSRSPRLRSGRITVGEAGRVRGEHLLLEAADRQHPALQRDLAGHADRVLDGAPGEQRRQRGGHRDAGARAVLGDRAGGHVDVELACPSKASSSMPELVRVAAHVGERDPRRLLHHVAQLAGEHEAVLALHLRRLDEQHVAADAGDREARGHARHRRAHRRLLEHLLAAERVAHDAPSVDRDRAPRPCRTRSASRSCAAPSRARARGCARPPRGCTRHTRCGRISSVTVTSSSRRPLRSRWRGHR